MARSSTVPTVADRIAQTVAALQLEPRTEQIFHEDSYGYRTGTGRAGHRWMRSPGAASDAGRGTGFLTLMSRSSSTRLTMI